MFLTAITFDFGAFSSAALSLTRKREEKAEGERKKDRKMSGARYNVFATRM